MSLRLVVTELFYVKKRPVAGFCKHNLGELFFHWRASIYFAFVDP